MATGDGILKKAFFSLILKRAHRKLSDSGRAKVKGNWLVSGELLVCQYYFANQASCSSRLCPLRWFACWFCEICLKWNPTEHFIKSAFEQRSGNRSHSVAMQALAEFNILLGSDGFSILFCLILTIK